MQQEGACQRHVGVNENWEDEARSKSELSPAMIGKRYFGGFVCPLHGISVPLEDIISGTGRRVVVPTKVETWAG